MSATRYADRLEAPQIARWQRTALIAGVAAGVACAAGAVLAPAQFFRSYLLGYFLWLGVGLGSLGITMLHNMTGGAWGRVMRPFLETGMRTIPLLALLFIPIALGFPHLYEWTHADAVAADPLLMHKAPYLNTPFALVRAAIYFAIWIGFATILMRRPERSTGSEEEKSRRVKLVSAPGILLYVLSMTFASFDWAMSLDPHWFSTIYGMLFIVGQVLSTFAFVLVLLAALRDEPSVARHVTQDHLHDIGNLLFAFVLLWAYGSLSQLIIIWSANIPEEIPWYLRRSHGGWLGVGVFLAVFHFIVPFFILLSRFAKRRAVIIGRVGLAILIMRFVDLLYLMGPELHHGEFALHWLDVAAPVAIGGLWLAFYFRGLRGAPAVSDTAHAVAGEVAHASD